MPPTRLKPNAIPRQTLDPRFTSIAAQFGHTAPFQEGDDTPVFDKRHAHNTDAASRVGLGSDSRSSASFTRKPSDSRPGTPVPFGEPHPNRLEIAEAIRLSIMAKEQKYGTGLTDPETGNYRPRKAAVHLYRPAVQTRGVSKYPDIPSPPGPYAVPNRARLRAERDGNILFFESTRAAAVCFLGKGDKVYQQVIDNAARGRTTHAFGWTWARIENEAKWS